jgi:RimJ/RimL family protein N-acetyltransferase
MSDDHAEPRHLPLTSPADGRAGPDALAAIFGEAHTERLTLRRVRLADGPALFAIDGDPETHRYSPAGPALTLAESNERLHEWMQRWEINGIGYWAVTRSSSPSQDIIGFGGVQRIVWRERAALNLYYRFTPSAWGQGYAAEMARMAVALARKHLPTLPVVALVRPANMPSLRTAERAGLERRPDLDTEHSVYALGWPR